MRDRLPRACVRLTTAATLAALLVGPLDPAPSEAASATVVVAGSAVKIRPKSPAAGSPEATIVAARDEFESFQVVVQAGATRVTNLSVTLEEPLSGPGGTIDAGNVTIYREAYYRVKNVSDLEGARGLWPDALIPTVDPWLEKSRKAFPIDVPARENRAAWIDVQVPQDAVPGDYDGSLAVDADQLHVVVPVQLTVIDWAMPSTSSLAQAFAIAWNNPCHAHYGVTCFDPEKKGWKINALYARVALDNRITISDPQYQPIVDERERALFEQYQLPLLEGTAPTRLPGARLTAFQADRNYLRQWRDEAKSRGFADRSFVYACDEPNDDAGEWRRCKEAAEAALAIWPEVSILITATIQSASAHDATGLIDLLVPIVQQMHDKPGNSKYEGDQRPKYDPFLNDPRNRLWMYTSCVSEGCAGGRDDDEYFRGWPGYVIDAPASEARAMGWQSFLYRTSGELYFQVDYSLDSAWRDQFAFGGNGDGTLFYPGRPDRIGGGKGSDIPIESLRLKLIRDGREDYEYLKFLADQGRGSEARAVALGLFPKMYETARSDAEVQEAHRRLADLIAAMKR